MEYHHGVKVEIICEGSILPCYQDPDSGSSDADLTSRHYIEARTGARFEVRVSLANNYDLQLCDYVRVKVTYDGGVSNVQELSAYGTSRTATFTGLRRFCPSTQTWRTSDLSFGDVKMSMISF